MKGPEQRPDQQFQRPAPTEPAAEAGQPPYAAPVPQPEAPQPQAVTLQRESQQSSQEQQGYLAEFIGYIDAEFIGYIEEKFQFPLLPTYAEGALQRAGVLSELEQAGIVPTEENASARGRYTYPLGRREALRYIYMGELIGFFTKQPRERDAAQKQQFLQSLEEGYNVGIDMFYEAELEKAGLLPRLEEASIIPTVNDPNPYHHEHEEEQAEQWWNEHPEEGEQFARNFEHREQAVKYLYVGTELSTLADVARAMPLVASEVKELKHRASQDR